MTLKFSISFLMVGLIIGSFISPFQSCSRKPETITKVEVDTVRSVDTVKQVIKSQPDTIRIYDIDTIKVTKNSEKFKKKLDSLRNLSLPLTVYQDTTKLDNGIMLFTRSQIRGYRESFDVSYTDVPTIKRSVHTTRTVKRETHVNLWVSGGVQYNSTPVRIQPQVGVGLNINRIGVFYDYAPFSPVKHSFSVSRKIPIF